LSSVEIVANCVSTIPASAANCPVPIPLAAIIKVSVLLPAPSFVVVSEIPEPAVIFNVSVDVSATRSA